MVDEGAFGKVVRDKGLACHAQVPALRSSVKQVGVPDENIAFSSLEVLRKQLVLRDQLMYEWLIARPIGSITLVLHVVERDLQIVREHIRQTVALWINSRGPESA